MTGMEKHSEEARHSAVDVLQAVLRFSRAVRTRKIYVGLALALAAIFGGIYFATATRIYEATASLMVTPRSTDLLNANSNNTVRSDTLIPTYESLFGRAVVLDGAIDRLLLLSPKYRIDFEDVDRDKWRRVLEDNLSAQALRRTNIIELTYRSKSAEAASAVVEAIVCSYLEFVEEDHKDMSTQLVEILRVELAKNEIELTSKKRQLGVLKEQVGDLGISDDDDLVHPILQRVVLINNRLAEVQQERIELHAAQIAIRQAVASDADLRQHLLTLEPFLGRELLLSAMGLNPNELKAAEDLKQKLLLSRARHRKLAEHFGPSHPERLELQQAIEDSEKYLEQMRSGSTSRSRERLTNESLGRLLLSMVNERLTKAVAHERELDRQYNLATGEAKVVTRELTLLSETQSDVERLMHLHDTLLDRIVSFDLSKNGPDVRVSTVGKTEARMDPVAPKLSLVVVLAALGGLSFGLGVIYVLDLMDDRFRSPEDLKDQLGVPVLAIVRKLETMVDAGAESLHVHIAPQSVEAEAFRTLRTTLSFSGPEMQRVTISSAEPGDGKTTVLANLGASFAQSGKRTLLIDADLRKPGLSTMFCYRKMPGLSDFLQSEEPIDNACKSRIQETAVTGMHVFPCGPKPADPAELLSRSRFDELVAWAEQNYDQVLIDCPPVMAASDAAIVGRRTDGLLLVVQPAKNHRRLVIRAVEHLQSMESPLVGIVANRVTNEQEDGYYGYGYGYGYGHSEDGDSSADGGSDNGPEDDDRNDENGMVSPRRVA